MRKVKRLTTPKEIRVYSNPFRFKILELFYIDKKALTVKQMADILKEVPSKVHYHVKELEKIDVMEIVETKERSGIVEKFYLPTAEEFAIDNIIRTTNNNIYEDDQDDIMGIVVKNAINDVNKYRENINPEEDDGRTFSQLAGYLTPEETRELHDMCVEYIQKRKKRKNTKLYNCTFLTIRKYDK